MDNIRARENGDDLQVSALAGVRSSRLTSSEDPSSSPSTMDSPVESMSVEWTDEKHSMYLKSMEASFVNDLYESIEMLGWCSNTKRVSHTKSTNPNPPVSPAQFKVHRNGCWRKINFERSESRVSKKNKEDHDGLLQNPWILRFSSAHNTHGGDVNRDAMDLDHDLNRKNPKQFRFYPCSLRRQDSNGSDTEVSDQNFVDEDNEGDKKKRVKTEEIDHCSLNDQVVPLHKP